MGDPTPAETNALSKTLLVDEAYDLALKLGLIVKQDGFSFEVCSPGEQNCAPLLDWYDSVLALGDCADQYREQLDIVQRYGFHQAGEYTCWAATATIAWAIRRKQVFKSESLFFWYDIDASLPAKRVIDSFVQSLSTNPCGLSSADVGLATAMAPDTDSPRKRAEFLGYISPATYLVFAPRALSMLNTTEDQIILAKIKMDSYYTIFPDIEKNCIKQGRTLGMSRWRDNEKRFFQWCGFRMEEVPFDQLTPEKLSALTTNATPITALSWQMLAAEGKDVPDLAEQFRQLSDEDRKKYYSHYVLVLACNPKSEQVFILNTLPVSGGSGRVPAYVKGKLPQSGSSSAQLCVMNFRHFREALISDVQIVSKNCADAGLAVSQQTSSTIPFMIISTTAPPFKLPQGGN